MTIIRHFVGGALCGGALLGLAIAVVRAFITWGPKVLLLYLPIVVFLIGWLMLEDA